MSVRPGVSLIQAVQQAVCAPKTGARVTQDHTSGDVFVHDCPVWGRENATLLRLLRPNADVTVQTSSASLSGFVIVVHEPAALGVRGRLLVLVAVAVVGGIAWSGSLLPAFPW